MKCSNCGTDNNELAMFCRKCGAKLSAGDAGAYQPPGPGKGATQVDSSLAGDPAFSQNMGDGGKGRTVVDQNVPGGGAWPPPPSQSTSGPQKKSRTIIDSGDDAGAGSDSKPGTPPASARKLAGFIVSYSNNPMGQFFPIYEGRVKIGSNASDCEVVVDDKQVSGTHALLLYRRGIFSIRDQDSSNGTFVDTTTVAREDYPDLYDGGGAALLKKADFSGKDVTLMGVEDERIILKDNSLFMIGNTVFKVKIVE